MGDGRRKEWSLFYYLRSYSFISIIDCKIEWGAEAFWRLPSPVQHLLFEHLARLVPEVAHTGKRHRNAVFVGSGDHFFVAN